MVARRLAVLPDHPHQAPEVVVEVDDVRGGWRGAKEQAAEDDGDSAEERAVRAQAPSVALERGVMRAVSRNCTLEHLWVSNVAEF
ncbi:MAG: hypothetical protein A3I14_08680 [Candidatus Rokubacteria bacterium RIFCSPLOWO2_02_FULL_73_56]|nr:MAG: hypothetical protein A3I14_08680 [Candidatus Rokubacteria bacterium RIFCSPLOWO2_02_FULL_73_56]